MRRLGAILMILGANIAVGSITAAFWLASLNCAMGATEGTCREGAVRLFLKQMTSGDGLIFWLVVVVGLLVFWKGKRMRAS